jgi:hypothetical protein
MLARLRSRIRNLTLTTKVALVSLVFFLIFGILINLLIRNLMEESLRAQTQDLTAGFVERQVGRHLSPDVFIHQERTEEEISSESLSFFAFFEEINTQGVIRINMWDNQATIIQSLDALDNEIDTPRINREFLDDLRYQQALSGVTNSIIIRQRAGSFISTSQPLVMEVYVPVYFPGIEEPVGVAEVHYSLEKLYDQTSGLNRAVFLILAAGFLALYVVLILVTKRASNTLQKQNMELEISRKMLAEQSENLEKMVEDRTTELQKTISDLKRLTDVMVGRELRMADLKKKISESEKGSKRGVKK